MAAAGIASVLAPSILAAQTQPPGFSVADLAQMLTGGVRPGRVLTLSNEACISFRPNSETDATLRAAGADSPMLEGLRATCFRAAPTVPAAAASAQSADEEKRSLAHALAKISPAALQRVDQIGYTATKVLLAPTFTRDTVYVNDPAGNYSEIKSGRIYLASRKQGFANVRGWDKTYDDVLIRYTMRFESGSKDTWSGIKFRKSSADDFFLISSSDGTADAGGWYGFDKHTAAGWTDLTPNSKTAVLHEGDNVIEVIVVGSSATLYINGFYVATATGVSSLTGTRIDYFTASGAVFSYADLVVVALGAR